MLQGQFQTVKNTYPVQLTDSPVTLMLVSGIMLFL